MTDPVALAKATIDDHAELARMNLALIQDEEYDRPLPIEKLTSRMKDFLGTTYTAYFIMVNESKAGYILVNLATSPVYIRQMYILPEKRRLGTGRQAIALLRDVLQTDTIDVEVMAWNTTGMSFWTSVGFRHRTNGLRWEKQSGEPNS